MKQKIQFTREITLSVSTAGIVEDEAGKVISKLSANDFASLEPDLTEEGYKSYTIVLMGSAHYWPATYGSGPSFSSAGEPPEDAEFELIEVRVWRMSNEFADKVWDHFSETLTNKILDDAERN